MRIPGTAFKRNAILIEVVAHADLTAEGIAARVKIHLVVFVIAGLHHDRHVQVGIADGIDDANLKAEVRQRHDDAVNLVAVLAELLADLQAVLAGLDAAAAGGRILISSNFLK